MKKVNMVTPNEYYPDLAKILQAEEIVFKREDLNPYGSHKGRSIPHMIDMYTKEGIKSFAISSSGNAALASGLYIKELNSKNKDKINLEILVGNNINANKLNKLKTLSDNNIKISTVERPLQRLFEITKDVSIKGLRQSTDDNSLSGYENLAKEIVEIPNIKRVYIGTSSGTTAEALLNYFIVNNKDIEVNIIQTSSCNPIAIEISEDEVIEEKSIADAIVDITAYRKNTVLELIKKTDSKAFIASNEEITGAQEIVKNNTGLEISKNSALSIVGLMKDSYTRRLDGVSMCIICGE